MNRIYVLASFPGAGKTTAALLLEHHFREQGLRVACLQQNKGPYDVHTYLSTGCYHYTVPLEATKSRDSFEQWVPVGYDVYILEITCPYTPFGAPYLIPFSAVNEIVPFDVRADWKGFALDHMQNYWRNYFVATDFSQSKLWDPGELWDIVHDRTVR